MIKTKESETSILTNKKQKAIEQIKLQFLNKISKAHFDKNEQKKFCYDDGNIYDMDNYIPDTIQHQRDNHIENLLNEMNWKINDIKQKYNKKIKDLDKQYKN